MVRVEHSHWIEEQTVSDLAAAEAVAQVGTGVLLLAVGVVELLLGAWSAGWWQRGTVMGLAAVGVVALARAAAARARGPASDLLGARAATAGRVEPVLVTAPRAARAYPVVEARLSGVRSG